MRRNREVTTRGEEAASFVIRMAEALHALGTPAHRLEAALARLARVVRVRAQVFSSPTSLFLAFGEGPRQRTVFRRVEPGEVDLGKLVELDEVLDALEEARIDLRAARQQLEAIVAAPARYGPTQVAVAHALASAGAATLFGGSIGEVVAAVVVGCALGLLAAASQRKRRVTGLFEPGAAMLATILAAALASGVVPVRDNVVVLAGIIVLVPGLSFTVGLVELTTRHLMSGTARLAGAAAVFLTLAFGVVVGRALVDLVWQRTAMVEVEPLPTWASYIALPVAAWAFSVLLKARRHELGWILLAAALAFASTRLTALALGPTMASFVGALVIGIVANTFARLRRRPASVPLAPGLLVLVPGSVGYRALDLFLAEDTTAGMQTGFEMMIAATSLVAGLLCAGLIVRPRRSL
jgi:uncharacterized membrane protein YjjP (DUF1212 family)